MRSFFACLFLAIVGIIILGLTIQSVWGNPTPSDIEKNINSDAKPYGVSPERNRFLLTQNLVEHSSFALSPEQAAAASPDVGFLNGNYYIYFAPGISIFAIPFYILGYEYNLSWLFTSSMVGLFTIANLIFIFLISRKILKLSYWASIFAALIFGFASTSLSYATVLYQHQTTAFFILSSFFAVYQYKIHKRWGFLLGFIIWTNYALAILIDYPNAVLLLPVMVYFLLASLNTKHESGKYTLKLRPAIIFTSVFFLIITYLHGYYNNVNFGGWTNLSGTSLTSITDIQAQKKQLQNESSASATEQSSTSDKQQSNQSVPTANKPQSAVQDKVFSAFLKETHLINSSYELLFAPDKGIFIFSPIFILGAGGILLAVKKKKVNIEIGSLIAVTLVNLFFYSSWGDPWGGWAYGPRYIIPSMATLAIFVVYFIEHFRYHLMTKIAAILLFSFSVAVALIGALTTDAVPPKIEADYLHSKYGFMFNWDYIMSGRTNSFVYNYFLHNLTLTEYLLYIFVFIVSIGIILIMLIPNRSNYEH